jgi:NAD(P)H-dependent FMN reductase
MGIAASVRRGSYNRALLNAAIALAPASLTIVPFPIDSIPLYNADVEGDDLRPLEVTKLKQAVAGADGVLLVGASAGVVGTARMQPQLKLAMMSTLALVMPHLIFYLLLARRVG